MNRSVGAKLKYFGRIGGPRSVGFTLTNYRYIAQRGLVLLGDSPAPFFLGLVTCKLEELDACGTNGVRPVVGAFGGRYTTGNLVE